MIAKNPNNNLLHAVQHGASLGQVHAAKLRDGRPVVVKVQRPNIRNQLADDIKELENRVNPAADSMARKQMDEQAKWNEINDQLVSF